MENEHSAQSLNIRSLTPAADSSERRGDAIALAQHLYDHEATRTTWVTYDRTLAGH